MDEISRKVRVEGRVQGVGFRAATLEAVRSLGEIRGFVRNLPDGAVEAVLVGPPAKVDAAIQWCRRGPSFSTVLRVIVEEGPESLEYQGFEIRR